MGGSVEGSPRLLTLPPGRADAYANMAEDLLLLDHFPWAQCIRFRSYGWTTHAVTFGYSQRFGEIARRLSASVTEICRRPTGGGIVDHGNDWTYSLVVPPKSALSEQSPLELYRLTHEAMANGLIRVGQRAELAVPSPSSVPAVRASSEECTSVDRQLWDPGICFQKAEVHDVVCPHSGRKIAGAALKKNRRGILLQGSIDRSAAPQVADWRAFASIFADNLADLFNATREAINSPAYPRRRAEEIHRRFKSREWNQKR